MTARVGVEAFLGWKRSPREKGLPKNKAGWEWVPNCSDVDSLESLTLGASILNSTGMPDPNAAAPTAAPTALPKNPGVSLEKWVEQELVGELPAIDPLRPWMVARGKSITGFAQYHHLTAFHSAFEDSPNLRVSIGQDYLIKPDVTVGVGGGASHDGRPFLHAAVSCKWTIRSDRVQNVRHEFLQMIRHRRGRQPHLVAVTAEPMPSRLASIARGTGEVDATYHIAFDELELAVRGSQSLRQQDAWSEVVGQGRIKNFEDLARDLCRW